MIVAIGPTSVALHARHTARGGWDHALAYLGGGACLAFAGGLLYYLASSERTALVLIAACTLAVVAARCAFTRAADR